MRTRRKIETLRDLVQELRKIHERHGAPCDEYFDGLNYQLGREIPDARWWAVYVVRGGSEGLYLHVDANEGGEPVPVLLGKTCSASPKKFQDMYRVAGVLAAALNDMPVPDSTGVGYDDVSWTTF